jgi:hypothetical protein
MPENVADPLGLRCYPLFSQVGIQESQQLSPDPSLPPREPREASPRQSRSLRAWDQISGPYHRVMRVLTTTSSPT